MQLRLRLGLCLLAVFPAATAAARDDASLEAYLRKVRAEREAEAERLRGRVQELATRLGSARSPQDLKKIHADFDALGGEAAPLLLPYLDPLEKPTKERERCSEEAALALARSRNPALHDELVRLARGGTPKGRQLALRVLGASPDVERASASLRALYPETQGVLRAECIRALAGLAPRDPLVVSALDDGEPAVVGAALQALTSVAHREPLPAVLELARDPDRAGPVLADLVRYFRVPGLELEEDSVAALLRLAARPDLPAEARLAALDAWPRFGLPLSTRLRKEVDPLVESSDAALREGVLVALTLLKDATAKRKLLRSFDDQVEKNARWPLGYQRRGDIHLRIGEYADAARDYRTAIELHADSSRLPGNRDLWVNLARAYVKDDKLRPAAEALEDFGLTSELRRTLREDPDFAALVEHSKYRKMFE